MGNAAAGGLAGFWVVCALGVAPVCALGCGGDAAAVPTPAPVVMTTITYDVPTVIEADQVVFHAGTHIVVHHGAALTIRARSVVVEGPVTIDGRGDTGSTPGTWTSSGGDDPFLQCAIAHRDWMAAEASGGGPNAPGGVGGTGATVTLHATTVTGLNNLTVNVQGGAGGPGLLMVCGCPAHMGESTPAATGPQGPAGTWVVEQG